MKIFIILLLAANVFYAGWHLAVGHPEPEQVDTSVADQGARLQLLSER